MVRYGLVYRFVEPTSHHWLGAGADEVARRQVETKYLSRQSGKLGNGGLCHVRVDRGSCSFASSWHDGLVFYR